MKKGRHRRFEEARKLKQQGPGAFFPSGNGRSHHHDDDHAAEPSDEFSDLAAKYGAFDDEGDDDADDD